MTISKANEYPTNSQRQSVKTLMTYSDDGADGTEGETEGNFMLLKKVGGARHLRLEPDETGIVNYILAFIRSIHCCF